jgi:hypothetical protein
MTLSRIVGEICVSHVRVMRNPVVSEEEVKCKNCDGYSFNCYGYKPVKNSGMRFSHLRLYEGAVR